MAERQKKKAGAQTVDAEGLLAELLEAPAQAGDYAVSASLEQCPIPQNPLQELLEKPLTATMTPKNKLVQRAIEAVQSGEFIPVHRWYYNAERRDGQPKTIPAAMPCGCAIAALHYAGQMLEIAPKTDSADRYRIHEDLKGIVPKQALKKVEDKFEKGHNEGYGGPADIGHTVKCLETLKE